MLKFTMKRLVYLVLVLVGVSFLVFLLLYMTPGDPVRMMLGESATPEAQAELRLELGLDDPFLVRDAGFFAIPDESAGMVSGQSVSKPGRDRPVDRRGV